MSVADWLCLRWLKVASASTRGLVFKVCLQMFLTTVWIIFSLLWRWPWNWNAFSALNKWKVTLMFFRFWFSALRLWIVLPLRLAFWILIQSLCIYGDVVAMKTQEITSFRINLSASVWKLLVRLLTVSIRWLLALNKTGFYFFKPYETLRPSWIHLGFARSERHLVNDDGEVLKCEIVYQPLV